jgi:hypothetical protein
MLVDVVTRLLPEGVETELEDLQSQLRGFAGHRTVWLDGGGQLWHAEPDELLEDFGHTYVGTFFRASLEELSIAVARALPPRGSTLHASASGVVEASL